MPPKPTRPSFAPPPPANPPSSGGTPPPANRPPTTPRPPVPPAASPSGAAPSAPPPRDPNTRYDLAGNPLPSSGQPGGGSPPPYAPPPSGYVPPSTGYVPPPAPGGYPPPYGGQQNYGPRYTYNANGGLILTFGILGFFCCMILSVAAWVMGNNSLAAIETGAADPGQRGLVNAGRICGIIGCVLGLLAIVRGVYIWQTHPAGFNPFTNSNYNRTYRYGGPGQPYSSDGSSNSSGSSSGPTIVMPAPSSPSYQPNNSQPAYNSNQNQGSGSNSSGSSSPFYHPPIITPTPPTFYHPPTPNFSPPMSTPPTFYRPPMQGNPSSPGSSPSPYPSSGQQSSPGSAPMSGPSSSPFGR